LTNALIKIKAQAEFKYLWNRRPKTTVCPQYRGYVQLYQEDNQVTIYEIKEFIGKSDCSLVFRATPTDRSVANVCIKMVPSDVKDKELANERFILNLLQGIVGVPRVLNYGTMNFSGNMMTALVTDVVGISLTQFSSRSLSQGDLEKILQFLLVVFSDIHRRGVIICDFKPDHIIISSRGIYIIDFGGSYRIGDTRTIYLFTSNFASYSALCLKDPKPEDDIESLILSLLYLFDRSVIPWWQRELSEIENNQFRKSVSDIIREQVIDERIDLSCLAREIGVVS